MREITIRIGYTWDESVRDGERWKALRTFCESAGKQGRSQAAATLRRMSTVEQEEEAEAPESSLQDNQLPALRVERLRATAGRFGWHSIRSRIEGADIVLFDFTPVAQLGLKTRRTSGNVWLELGYAYGKLDADNVFVTHADSDGYKTLPSDLNGLIVGHIPSNKNSNDRSLRSVLAGAVKRIVLDRMNSATDAWGQSH